MSIRGKYIFRGIGHRGNGFQGKWTFGERGTLNALKFLCPFPLKRLQMGSGANGHLRKMDIWGKGVPQVPYRGISSALSLLTQNVHKRVPRQMGIWGKWTFGGKGYPKCLVPFSPKCLQMGTEVNRHLGQMYIWGKGVLQVP